MSLRLRQSLLCGSIAVLAAVLSFASMPRGPGVSRDSGQYFRYAQIIRGQAPVKTEEGVAVALTHYPPLYPVSLATLEKVGMKPMHAARLINALCYGLTCGLAAALVLRHARGERRAVAAGLLVMVQPAMAFIHLWVVSEPPFLLLTVLLFGLLLEYVTRPGRGLLIAIGIGACLATAGLTRYVGVAFLPAACWVVWRSRTQRRALLNACVVGVVAVVPLLVMGAIQRRVAGEVAHRDIGYEPLTWQHGLDFLRTVRDWVVSPETLGANLMTRQAAYRFNLESIATGLAAVVFVAGVVLLVRFGRRSAFGYVAGVMSVVYLGLLLFSIAFVDHGTPLDDRLLAPVALVVTVWLAADFPAVASFGLPRRVGYAAAAVTAVVAINSVVRAATDDAESYRLGLGFNHVFYRDSALVAECGKLPAAANVYSNFPEPIILHTGHNAFVLPGRSMNNGMMNTDERSITYERLSRNGYVAFFSHRTNPRNPGKPMTIDEILATYPLKAVARTKDGTLFKWDPKKAAARAATQAKEVEH